MISNNIDRMRLSRFAAILLTALTLVSCFKEEPLNAECDITQVSFSTDNPSGIFFNLSDTSKTVPSTDSTITFVVRRNHDADLSALTPRLTLTPGATALLTAKSMGPHAGGTLRYRVTSEDRLWHRDYTIALTPMVYTVSDTVHYDFEHFELEPRESKYYVWHNVLHDGTLGNDWANGNPGFRISMGTVAPVDEWTPFELTFRYTGTIDYDLLDSREYSLAIVFSSSNEGDKFEGAIGSELCIDKVSIICRKEQ